MKKLHRLAAAISAAVMMLSQTPCVNAAQAEKNDILIAYFTAAENSGVDAVSSATMTQWAGEDMGAAEALANIIHDNTDSDMFSVRTEQTYPTEYSELAEFAKAEKENGELPQLSTHIEDLDKYRTVIMVFPVWWYTMPRAINSFFEEYDFSGKTIAVCTTSGGSGLAGTPELIQELEPEANVITDGFTADYTSVPDCAGDAAKWAFDNFDTVPENSAAGDVNADGEVNVTDISLTAAHVKGVRYLTDEQQAAADVSGDDSITVTDISLLAAHIKGIKALQ